MAPFLDVIIGGSIRAAIAGLKNYNSSEYQDTIRVFSRSFDAPRRMEEKDAIHVFHSIGICSNLVRLEICSPIDSPRYLELPALAIAESLLQSSNNRSLKDLLLTRVRLSGGSSDMNSLAYAMANHKSINRLFISDCHPQHQSASMSEFLRAAATNPQLESLVVRDVPWAGEALCSLEHESSCLESIRVEGPQCIGPIAWVHFVENLRFNGALKELRITACVLCPGMGLIIARVLAVHKVLEDLVLEFQTMAETVPVCRALASNTVLKRLDLHVYSPGSDSKQRLVISLFAETMSQNYTMQYFSLRSADSSFSSPLLEFYLRLNRCANRKHLLQSERPPAAKEWVGTIMVNRNDVSIIYYILHLNPSLCQNLHAKNERNPSTSKRARKRKRYRDA
jgi:hypothetical protein